MNLLPYAAALVLALSASLAAQQAQEPREIQPLPSEPDGSGASAAQDAAEGELPYAREAVQAMGDGSGEGGGHSSHYSNEVPGSTVPDPREPELSGTTQSDNPLGEVGAPSIETSADYGSAAESGRPSAAVPEGR